MTAANTGRYDLDLTAGAERDLESIFDYVSAFDSTVRANQLLDRPMATATGLSESPQRGSHRRELLALGIKDYRQITFKLYRLIYRVMHLRVVIYLIVDGRRDMQSLLTTRLLGG